MKEFASHDLFITQRGLRKNLTSSSTYNGVSTAVEGCVSFLDYFSSLIENLASITSEWMEWLLVRHATTTVNALQRLYWAGFD